MVVSWGDFALFYAFRNSGQSSVVRYVPPSEAHVFPGCSELKRWKAPRQSTVCHNTKMWLWEQLFVPTGHTNPSAAHGEAPSKAEGAAAQLNRSG